MKRLALIAAVIAIAAPAMAQQSPQPRPPYGTAFPGNINNNPYDPNNGSWAAYSATPDHPWGTCGSSYSPNCVNNPHTR